MRYFYGNPGRKSGRSDAARAVSYPVTITSGTEVVADLRRSGKVVCLNLMLTSVPSTNQWPVIGSIPAEIAPLTDVRSAALGSSLCWLKVDPSGQISAYSQTSATLNMGVSLTWILP